MATWRVDLHNLNSGTVLVSDLQVQDWLFNYTLNSPGAMEADVWFADTDVTEALIQPGSKEVRVWRDSNQVWGGYLWNVQVDTVAEKLRLLAEGYYSALRRRRVSSDLIYTDVNIQTIMWNLIAHTQAKTNGSLGITQGSHTGGNRTTDRDFCATDYPIVADGIDELTNMDDGCDWVVTPTIGIYTNKVFHTYQPYKGSDVTGSVTLNQTNLFSLTYEVDASELSNYVTYVGPGDCNPPDVLVEDATSQSSFGLMEEVVESDDTGGIADLTAHAREYLRNFKNPRYQAEATYYEGKGPAWGSFVLGDSVTLASNKGYATFSRPMRVIGVEVELNKSKANFFRVTLDSVVS